MKSGTFMSSRRSLLRGLGAGAVVLAPFVRAVRARAAGTPRGNFCVFHTPNGHVRSAFGASGVDDGFALKPSLAPLEPWKGKLSMAQDLDDPGASEKASHEDCVRTLTCVPGGDLYTGQGTSIDWVVAQAAGQRPLTLSSLWPAAPNWQTKISWKQSGVFDAHRDDPKAVFDELFANFMPPGTQTPSAMDALRAQKKSVLDFVREDANLLMGRLPKLRSSFRAGWLR